MTKIDTIVEQVNVRELSTDEIGCVGGGSVSLGTWFKRFVWQWENMPQSGTSMDCSDDMSVCTFK